MMLAYFFLVCVFVCCSLSFLFFFFKQKTAYEMRISDWSSDVCSSDLPTSKSPAWCANTSICAPKASSICSICCAPSTARPPRMATLVVPSLSSPGKPPTRCKSLNRPPKALVQFTGARSEEHTSELQSLMRISYAVFCLKKKKQYTQNIEKTPTITKQT